MQFEADYLFKTIIALPNVTFALAVFEASEPELTTVQDFLDRYYKRRYMKVKSDHRSKFSNLSNWKEEA